MSDFAIHLTADIIGEADRRCQGRVLRSRRRSRCFASLTTAIRLAKLAAKR
jgi:hypothetical protein